MIEVAATTDRQTDIVVVTEEALHQLLLDYAASRARPRMYPKAVVEFAEKIVKDVINDLDLDEIGCPADGTPSLLLRTLEGASDHEMRPYDPMLLALAVKVHEYPGGGIVTLESANRILIDLLDLNALFEQEYGPNMSITLISTEGFSREFGPHVHIRQTFTYDDIPKKH
jgi:hypothetical protein